MKIGHWPDRVYYRTRCSPFGVKKKKMQQNPRDVRRLMDFDIISPSIRPPARYPSRICHPFYDNARSRAWGKVISSKFSARAVYYSHAADACAVLEISAMRAEILLADLYRERKITGPGRVRYVTVNRPRTSIHGGIISKDARPK